MKQACPRSGAVELVTLEGDSYWLPTICKTWGCNVCRKKLLALVQARMQYGMERLGDCLFITVTYVMHQESDLRDALSVLEDLKTLWRTLRKKGRWQDASYVRVPELTQRGQVHVHMIVGNVKGNPSCRKRKEPLKTWKARKCTAVGLRGSEECLQHELSSVWLQVTGTAFVVDVSKVRSGPRTAAYVTAYIEKDFSGHEVLASRGFKRRYAFSRNWPSMGRMQLALTRDKKWQRVTMVPTKYLRMVYPEINSYVVKGGDTGVLEQVGENVVTHVFGDPETNRLKRAMKKIGAENGTTTL